MRRRLRWLSHKLETLWPASFQIRNRLLIAGTLLCILALMTPIYMRTKVRALSLTYNWSASNWEMLSEIHGLGRSLSDFEAKLSRFATTGNPRLIPEITRANKDMGEVLNRLSSAVSDQPHRARLVDETVKAYRQWVNDVVVPHVRPTGNLTAFSIHLGREPLQPRMQSLLNELADDIHRDNIRANNAVLRQSQNALLTVTYGGIFFFAGFAVLVLSLWFTIIPGLHALLHFAGELKKGNLDHHIRLPGRNEMSSLGAAFNEMAVSLKARNEKLKDLNRMKSDFVSTVSHELRTPLTAIKGSIGLILGGVTGPISAETSQMLRITQKNTDRLIRLINDVLDVAKIEAGAMRLRFEKHSLIDTISHAVEALRPFASEHGIKINWAPAPFRPLVVMDHDRIEQVVTNLLSNAIKYSEEGATVTVSCEKGLDQVVVAVRDSGQGIAPEFLERIFQKFQQADGAIHKAKEGTGLGLTIAKTLVEEHSGSIWVRSQPGKGSTFSFALPWNGTELEPEKADVADNHPTRDLGKHILIIDDEADFTTVLEKLLTHEGYRVTTAHSGPEGLRAAQRKQPDLILLDVIMPGMTGIEVQKQLAEDPATRDIPLVFATIRPEEKSDKPDPFPAPVLAKPLVPDALVAWLRDFFESRSSRAA